MKVFVDEKDLSESEFFARELGIDFELINPLQSRFSELNFSGCVWIASTRPELWQEFIASSPRQSIVLFYLGNELYRTHNLTFLSTTPSIRALFLYSPMKSPSIANLISSFMGASLDSGLSFYRDTISYLRNLRSGFEVLKNLRSHSHLYQNIIEIPQGYSSAFAVQLSKRVSFFESKVSIIDNITILDSLNEGRKIQYDCSFVGQSGNLRRSRFLDVARQLGDMNTVIVVRQGYAGNNRKVDNIYFDYSLASRVVLVPPGVFNNYNHRYCESLILNKLPIVVCNNQTDPNTNYYWVKEFPFILRDSARYILYVVKNLEHNELVRRVQSARRVEFDRIKVFRNFVHELSKVSK